MTLVHPTIQIPDIRRCCSLHVLRPCALRPKPRHPQPTKDDLRTPIGRTLGMTMGDRTKQHRLDGRADAAQRQR